MTTAHAQIEALSPANDSLNNLIPSSRFEVYKITPEQGSELDLPRDNCVTVVQATQPREIIMKFSYKDLVSERIAVSAENCTTSSSTKFRLTLLLSVPGQRLITLFLPITLQSQVNARIPRLIVGEPLRVIPGTDVHLTASQLQLAASGVESLDPSKIYLFAADGFPSNGGYLHRRGSCRGLAAAVDLFSLFEVVNEDIVYHSPDPVLAYRSPQPALPSSIHKGNPSETTYTVVGANAGDSGRNIISLETGEALRRFSQADVNRRRLAYSISYTLSYAASSRRRIKEKQDKNSFQTALSLVVSRPPTGNELGLINSTVR
ncbi:unnamed protein product [Dibothriocephalus latus]|uniref:Uncharacterized protein n=1 Tax=Dibothriocephalus latus TaxID=60516 RepID=A0A3P6S7H6_DIBLA|nr:unnamed protein product [Dibothriocephalus latus]